MGADLQNDAIKAIYDAALTRGHWRTALDSLVDSSSATFGMLFDHGDLSEIRYAYNETSRRFSEPGNMAALKEYNEKAMTDPDWTYDRDGLSRAAGMPAHKVIVDADMFTMDEAYMARPEVQFTRQRIGFHRRFIVKFSEDPLRLHGLILQYPLEFSDFPAADFALAEALSPHFARATELHRITQPLREKYNAALSVLDMIDLPILVTARDGKTVLKNRAAGDVLSNRDVVWESNAGHLVARDEDESAALSEAIARASRTARGEGRKRSIDVALSRGPGQAPVFALVSPLRDAAVELERGLTGAIVTLIDPTYPVRARVDLVAAAYGMTPAEAQAAELIAAGQSNPEMAERIGVSVETVKTHVRAVLRKTGSRNRMAFLWRVYQFAPPIR